MNDKHLPMIQKMRSNSLAVTNRVEEVRKATEEARRKQEEARETLKNRQTNLIFGIDATSSRARYWEQTSETQSAVFFDVAKVGGKLYAQLVVYSGLTEQGDLIASRWQDNAFTLCEEMSKIKPVASKTQIEKVIKHTLCEHATRNIDALIVSADSCEENEDSLVRWARELKKKDIMLFLFDDADGSTQRHPDTTRIFKAIARAAEGEYIPFDLANISILTDYLKTVAVAATRDANGVKNAASTARTPEGRLFAEKMVLRLSGPKPPHL